MATVRVPILDNSDLISPSFLPVIDQSLGTLLAGEDLAGNVLGTLHKPAIGALYAPSTHRNTGAATKGVVKAVAGNVFSIRVSNVNAAVRYFQLHNLTANPTAGVTPQQSWIIPAGTATNPAILQLDSGHFAPSEYFPLGIAWSISTTLATFTDSATAADHSVSVRYA